MIRRVFGRSVSSMVGVLAANREPERFSRPIMVGPSPRYINDTDYVGGFERADIEGLLELMDKNYIGWASFFAPAGGTIAVTCETDGDRTRIRVRDTGIGIAEEDLPRIFAPFVQVGGVPAQSHSTSGVGLGLAISRDLARAMQGEVTAESTPGQGSTFTIDLPAATGPVSSVVESL